MSLSEAEKLESRARNAATRAGLILTKSRKARGPLNHGGFQLLRGDRVIHGKRFELLIQQVAELLQIPIELPEKQEVTTVLAQKLEALCSETGYSKTALTVMSHKHDPYRLDNEENNRNAKWFAEMMDRFVPSGTAHLRGLHYRIVAATGVLVPLDGLRSVPYQNNLEFWLLLSGKASRAARWLGYVDPDRVVDERNEPPEYFAIAPDYWDGRTASITAFSVGSTGYFAAPYIDVPRPNCWAQIHADATAGSPPPQKYRITLIGEKSSLREVLLPIADSVAGDLYLPNGEISHTMIWDLCKRSAADSRPTVVLYFSDFDPSGFHMPTNVSRRIQAIRDLKYPDLNLRLFHTALTFEQVLANELPSSVIKETEARKGAWLAKWGREQTEIDALAALNPSVLRAIVLDALKPFYDNTVADRNREAAEEWSRAANEALAASPYYEISVERMEAIKEEVENATDDIATQAESEIAEVVEAAKEKINAELEKFEVVRKEAETNIGKIDVPPMAEVELELAPAPEPVYDSNDDWMTATLKLVERRKLVPDDDSPAEDAPNS